MKNNLQQFITNGFKGIYQRLNASIENPYKKLGISWLKMRMLKNLSSNTKQQITLLSKPFFFNRNKDFLHSLKEIFIDNIYLQQLKNDPYIIDCGANVGLSVIYLKELFPNSTIIAFEPDKVNFELLEKNIRSFGYSNVVLRNEAVWIANTALNFASTGTLGSKIELDANYNSELTKAIRLKDLLDQPVDFLKIDIEGAEYAVLKDIDKNLTNVINLFIEYHGSFQQNEELNEILQLIVDNGFRYYIKEAAEVHKTPFFQGPANFFDLQLNIFCFK